MTDVQSAVLYTAAPERRINPFRPELRLASDGSGPKHIVGYASVFDRLSRNLGGFVERVNQRAFNASKANGFEGAVCRWNHNDDFLLGTIAGRTCSIDVDGTGLLYDAVPPDTTAGRDVMVLMGRGDVAFSSFAFRAAEDDWALSDFGLPLRTLLSMEVIDVAPVTTPAYPDATSSLRSVDGAVLSLAARFDADPTEIRSLLDTKQAKKLFTRSDMLTPAAPPVVPELTEEPMSLSGEHAAYYEEALRAVEEDRKDYDKDSRDKMAKAGTAMPDGSFPIADEDDLHNAVKLAGHASNPAAAKAHIKKRAAAMGKSGAIPEDWDDDTEKKSADEESERAAKATYSDMETCGDCNTTNQFGKHCTNCGKPMNPDSPMPGKFCSHCGGKTAADSKRSEHECGVEERTDTAETEEAEGESEEESREADAPEETAAPSDDTETRQPGGTSDNGHVVSTADENRQKLMLLLEKRYDPFVDSDE